ncbi:P-loop containing nucleoside triphosphate hydrolase protein [Diplogelasinospora grovesii]|uniref:P-loop containing nucleoside triphosphate hydrolase protein n=1 Tax=Diplogelasinospora grovesii TaxID=303347 RepID=A0AAN6MY53_9PEZI|nr:P-loop containing nucleoside triphosphate hydrolase protein [Diplogelasinospora grovesii]
MSYSESDYATESDGIILLMGVTGAGKSYFLNQLKAGSVGEGHGLRSETKRCKGVKIELHEEDDDADGKPTSSIYVVDTPGFDDTDRGEGEIFEEISRYLATQYKSGIPLKGILFFHRITDNRITGSSRKYMSIFRSLCGDHALKNVILVTTMWNKVPPADQTRAFEREQELIDDFWAPMLRHRSFVAHFNGTSRSASSLVWQLARKEDVILDIQRQIIDDDLEVYNTAAGQQLASILQADRSRCAKRIAQLKKEWEHCRDEERKEELRQDIEETQETIDKITRSLRKMAVKIGDRIKEKIKDALSGPNIRTAIEVLTIVLNITLTIIKFVAS